MAADASRLVPGVDVVIVNWNTGPLLRRAIEPLAQYLNEGVSVTVVDNASSDGSEAELASAFPGITVIRNERNQGFARACNRGAKDGRAEYVLFLNPDASIEMRQLQGMLDFMSRPESADIAALGPQIRNPAGGVECTSARTPELRHLISRAFGAHRFFPKFTDFMMREFDHRSSRFVDQVIGACLLTRRSEFEALGGFDERYFVYFEEVDYCRRIRERGHKVYFLSEQWCTHVGGGSTSKVKAFRLFLSLQSRIIYAYKWFKPGAAFAVDLTSLCIEPLTRILHALVSGTPTGIGEVMNGAGRLWRWRAGERQMRRLRCRALANR